MTTRGIGPPMGRAVDPARRVAYDLLRAVSERDAYANLVLPALLRKAGLAGRDAALATELAYGTLRWRGSYDAVLSACVDRPLDRLDPPLLDALRLGSHQLLSMRTPPHAAVSQTVALVRSAIGHRTTGLANAVLRKVGRADLPAWVGRLAPDRDTDPVGHRAVATSHPRWVVEALGDALGTDGAELDELLAAHNTAPSVTLVARPGLADVETLRRKIGAAAGRWSPYAAVLAGGDPAALSGVRTGRIGVQDEASQLAALAMVGADVDGRDEAWLDLCAGPGGKAALLGALAAGRGARVTAHELAPHRADLVRRSTAPLGDRVQVRVGDGRDVGAAEPARYDRVLVDAPCTGLGALRRRPEARWRRVPGDVGDLVRLQGALLASALRAVRPGGVVLYATCTPVLAETLGVVDRVLAGHPGVALLDARDALDDIAGLRGTLPARPTVQLWPHRHGTDAMFLALLRRR